MRSTEIAKIVVETEKIEVENYFFTG